MASSDKNKDFARKIWLAGIGAYGKAFVEGKEVLKSATERGSELFEELVAKGETLEKTVETQTEDAVEELRGKMGDIDIDARIKALREKIRSGSGTVKRKAATTTRTAAQSNRRRAPSDVQGRLDDLETKIDMILDRMGAKIVPKSEAASPKTGSVKAASKTKMTTKTTTARKKAPAKTSPAKAPPARKTAAKKAAPKKAATKKASTPSRKPAPKKKS